MKGIRLYKSALQQKMLRAVHTHTAQAEAFAREIVPYGNGSDGGHLRDCIFSVVTNSPGCVAGEISARNPHALPVELGASHMKAQPYLRPALLKQKASFLSALKK